MTKAEKAAQAEQEAVDATPLVDVVDDRGQIFVPLGGVNYVLRPSWEAIVNIERDLRPLYQLAADAGVGALSLEELAVIVTHMMHAYGKANPEDALARDYKGAEAKNVLPMIYTSGAVRICARVMIILAGALNGGYTAEGEAVAATTQQSEVLAAE